MLAQSFARIVRPSAFAAFLALILTAQSKAGDHLEISAPEYKKVEAMMRSWLALVDKGKFAESFATASELFRRDSTVEQWAASHSKMLKEVGAVVRRGEISSFISDEKPNNRTLPSMYFVNFKTKFKKKGGAEHLQIVKEGGEWKVASYSLEPDK